MDPHLTNIGSPQSPPQPLSPLPVDDQAAGIPHFYSVDYLFDLFSDPSDDFIHADDQNPNLNPHSDHIVGENLNLIPSDHEDHASPNFANREDEINPNPNPPPPPLSNSDFLVIQNVNDELPWAPPEDNREDEINPSPPPPPTSDGDLLQITNVLSDGPRAPPEDNSTIQVMRKQRTDGIVAAGRTSEDTGRRPINVSSTQCGPARTKGKSVAANGHGSGRVGVKRPRDQPSEANAAEVIATKTPKMEVEVELSIDDKEQLEDYESLQKTHEFLRVKIEEAVGVLKPKITSVSDESSNEAMQQLELIVGLAWQHNHIKILNNSEE